MIGLWGDPIFQQIAAIVLVTLFVTGVLLFVFRKRNPHFTAAWASFRSWLVLAPLLLIVLSLDQAWAHVLLFLISIWAAKLFFKMTGMFHRPYFVWTTYIAIALGYVLIGIGQKFYLPYLPMALFASICLIPLIRNSYKRMIQYLGLTMINFLFIWGFMHLALLLTLERGAYMFIYLVVLTEVSDNIHLGCTRLFGKIKIAPMVTNKRSLEGFLIAAVFTILAAWGLRHLLPERSEVFWLSTGLLIALAGGLGDMVMSVIRRDLGIKVTGAFIFGRSDYLTRVDRFFFVAPLFYYLILFLLRRGSL